MRRALWVVAGLAALAAATRLVPWQWVLAPLLGLLIWQVGVASLGSLRRGADHLPDGPPVPVDAAEERVTYVCGWLRRGGAAARARRAHATAPLRRAHARADRSTARGDAALSGQPGSSLMRSARSRRSR